MVTIYTEGSNARCKKAVQWLEDHEVAFKQVNIIKTPLTKEDLLKIVTVTESGLNDLLSDTGRKAGLDDLLLHEALEVLVRNPKFVKKPILYNGKIVQSGYNDTQISAFIPREQREHYYVGM